MLREIDQNIWVSERQFKSLGLEVGTRMTAIRLGNGELIVISSIDVDVSFPWQTRLIAKILGGDRQLEPTILEKLASRDKEQVKQSIQQVLCWDFDRVIVAHGSIVERDGKRQLQVGYEKFLSTTNLQIAC